MRVLLCMLLLLVGSGGYAQIITTVAGGATGHGGYYGDGGQATAAELWGPVGLAIDSHCNLYIGDGQINRVRKVDLTTGIITTCAGTGSAGFFGDGGPATLAKLNRVSLMAIDAYDNIYICDALNNRIRKIDAVTGIISTFAGTGLLASTGDGGPATDAAIMLGGMACDNFGNMYVCDYDKVRKIDPAGIITTVVGDGLPGITIDGAIATATHIGIPIDIAIDNDGNPYISDSTFAIRKLTVSTGILSRVAGVGDAIGTYSGDGIPATTCRMITSGISIDHFGNIYNAGYGNQRVERIDTFGIINTIAGNGVGGFLGDGTLATIANLNLPKDIAFDKCGNMYISDFLNKRIRKVTFPPILTVPEISISGPLSAFEGSTVTISATIVSAGSSYVVHWMNHGLEFATTTTPSVMYTKPIGTDTITAKVVSTSSCGCYDSTISTGHMVYDGSLGMPSNMAANTLQIYPNPAHTTLTISGNNAPATISICNILGIEVAKCTLANGSTQLNIAHLPLGIYAIKADGVYVQRLVKE